MIENLWDESNKTIQSDTLGELTYRSNLIGTDRRVCNWGGEIPLSKRLQLIFEATKST